MTKESKIVCEFAYERAEIHGISGAVNCCCRSYTNDYSFGNLKENTIEEIWNSEKAQKFRQSMLDGKYEFCKRELCNGPIVSTKYNDVIAPLPRNVEMGISTKCNVLCNICRDKESLLTEKNNKEDELYNQLHEKFLGIIKNAKTLGINSWGEALCDKNCKKLLQEAIKINPKLKIYLLTNGLFCDKKHLEDFGIYNNIHTISLSVHATTKETYDKIVKYSDFQKIKENINWVVEERLKGNFKRVILNFVVQKLNYKEMVPFVKWVRDLGHGKIEAHFWEYRMSKITNYEQHYKENAVFLPDHPEYEDFIEVLKDPIFKRKYCSVCDFLMDLKSQKTN